MGRAGTGHGVASINWHERSALGKTLEAVFATSCLQERQTKAMPLPEVP
ncbi:hypothetical protein Slala04_28870 [Streptomyces lavendulae subsp. lavendulae]|nr:hypothetical protein Slala04_28870 [Streptomyces lavendulae subsp. lavendulae]